MPHDRNSARPRRPSAEEAARERRREEARRALPSSDFLRRENATEALRTALEDYIVAYGLAVVPGCTDPQCDCGGFGPVPTLSLLEEVADATQARAGVPPMVVPGAPNPERAGEMLRAQAMQRVRAQVPRVADFAERLRSLDAAALGLVLTRSRGAVDFPAWPDVIGEMDDALAVITDGRALRGADPIAAGLPDAAERVAAADPDPDDARALLGDPARAAANALLLDGIARPDACSDAWEPFAPVLPWDQVLGGAKPNS